MKKLEIAMLKKDFKMMRQEFKCEVPVCGQNFTKKSLLVEHAKTVSFSEAYLETKPVDQLDEGRVHQCQYCGKQYKTRNWLRRHIYFHCSKAKKVIKYTCDVCDRKFKSVVAFRKHKISHRIENDTLTKDCDNEVLQDKQNGDDGRKYTENEIQKMSEVDNIEPKKENIEQHNSYEITSPDITTEDAVHK